MEKIFLICLILILIVSVYNSTIENLNTQNMLNYYECKKNKYLKNINSDSENIESNTYCQKFYSDNNKNNFLKTYKEKNLRYLLNDNLYNSDSKSKANDFYSKMILKKKCNESPYKIIWDNGLEIDTVKNCSNII